MMYCTFTEAHSAVRTLLIAVGGDLADDNLYMLNIRAGEDRAVWSVKSNQPITPGRRYGHVMAFMKPFLVVFGGNTGT